jgi:hypothetical protein
MPARPRHRSSDPAQPIQIPAPVVPWRAPAMTENGLFISLYYLFVKWILTVARGPNGNPAQRWQRKFFVTVPAVA